MKPTKVRKPRQRRPHERSVRIIIPALHLGEPLTYIRITQDGEAAHYWVSPLASDWGLAFRFEKPGHECQDGKEESYDVLIENAQDSSCTCPGHTYGGYCKHADAVRALIRQGQLPLPSVPHAPVAAHADEDCPF